MFVCTIWVDYNSSVVPHEPFEPIIGNRGCEIGHNLLLVVVDLVHSIVCLLLLRAQEVTNESDSLTSNDEGSSDGSLASGDQSEAGLIATVGLLVLAGVGGPDVVAALEALVVGEQDKALGVGIQLVGGLLDDRKALVDLGQCLVAKVVCLLDVGLDILVGPVEVGDNGGGKGLVGRVAELDGLCTVGVRLERLDSVVNNVVIIKVLCQVSLGSDDGGLAREGRLCGQRGSAQAACELVPERSWFPLRPYRTVRWAPRKKAGAYLQE